MTKIMEKIKAIYARVVAFFKKLFKKAEGDHTILG